MRTVSYRLADLIKARIPLGFVGENEHTVVQFDAKQAFDQYPTATPSLTVKNPSGEKYPAVVIRDGDMVIWTISDSDLIVPGRGEFQLQFKEGDTVMRSYVGETRIERSIMPTGDVPTPVQNWIDAAEDVLEEVEEAIPAGGTTGQVLAKASDADRDLEWVDQTGGGGGTSNYNDLSNKPQIGGVTLSGNKTLHDLGAAAEEDIPVVHNVPAGGSANQVLAKNSGTDYDLKWVNQSGGGGGGAEIDDTAGEGDTDVVWSANKTWTENEALKEAIENDLPETKPSNATGVDLDFCDESGNVILRLKDGDIQTKNFNSHDPYIVPGYYHADGYLAGKCNRLNQLARACAGKMDTFAFCTDQHWHLNAGKSPALLRYIKENTNIDKFFFGGDFCDFITGESQPFNGFRQYNEALDSPLYTAMGNHDYMSQYGTEGRLYYTFNSVGRDRFGNFDRNYFYIDNPQSMIRYIFLNGFQPDGNGSWAWGLEQDQLSWLTNTALDLENGWGAIIVTHMIEGIDLDTKQMYRPTAVTNLLTALDSYSGNGEIIGIICGHTHFDYVSETTGGIPIIVTTSDKYQPWIYQDVDKEPWLSDREAGTITEQAIDMYVVDREAKTLTRVRVGVPIRDGYDPTTWTEVEEETVSYDRT